MLPVALPTRIADLPAFTARVNAEALRQSGDPAAELDVLGYSRSSHTHDIVYQEFRTNHLMHKLYSEWALGASADRLKESYDGLLPVLEPLTEPAVTITKTNLRNHLGQHK
ncbi:hypothetical protein IWQ60_008270 [Tieghemiomyces parasiticus]|uniref:Uncharacterized protein n=1 Tax=Tieghemiomyces parasiticus TaxID=78921 RepID=A0A9W8DRS6_9FUNG|nr:hypothetical protein IWQ60_008270 [Tieghemiomyces parasiticus]